MANIYVIGSLRGPRVPEVANQLRAAGHEVFDDWYAAGPEADDYWQKYEENKGHNYREALDGYSARDVYNFDKSHLDRNDIAVLVLPAGKSGHLELGYMIGSGKQGFILFDDDVENCRWDVMYQFTREQKLDDKVGVCFSVEELLAAIKKLK